jgi:amino acid adenylation domain-containing protein
MSPEDVVIRIAGVAATAPARPAVRDVAGRELTYGALLDRAGRIARRLAAEGIGPEDRVGVIADRSADSIAAVVGVLMSGAAYVTLEPDAPEHRTAQIVAGTRVRTTLDPAGLVADLPAADAAPVPARALAYVLHTSGSSGRPKGVMIERGSVAEFVAACERLFGIRPEDRVLQFSSFAFDTSVFEVFTALAAGCTLVVAGADQRGDVRALTKMIRDERVTVADIPPSVLELMTPDEVPGLRLIFSGGEACSAELATRWALSHVQLWHGYGPTETTVAATAGRCDAPRRTRMPLGRPIGRAAVHVLDGGFAPVPSGTTGELCVAGPGVGRGYFGDPAATAAVFVPDPFGGVPGARLYRTGDLVRYDADGELMYLGRRDRQLKVRGVRIEPAEIEDALLARPGVRQALADRIETADGRERLVAFVACAVGRTGPELRAELSGALPSTMIPDEVVTMKSLPRTVNDKVDRRALMALLPGPRTAGGTDETAGFSELEARVASRLFGPALGQVPAAPGDDFFGLGGNSLEAIKLLSAVPAEFGVSVSVGEFIAEPTVRGLARAVESSTTVLLDEDEDLLAELLDELEQGG